MVVAIARMALIRKPGDRSDWCPLIKFDNSVTLLLKTVPPTLLRAGNYTSKLLGFENYASFVLKFSRSDT